MVANNRQDYTIYGATPVVKYAIRDNRHYQRVRDNCAGGEIRTRTVIRDNKAYGGILKIEIRILYNKRIHGFCTRIRSQT